MVFIATAAAKNIDSVLAMQALPGPGPESDTHSESESQSQTETITVLTVSLAAVPHLPLVSQTVTLRQCHRLSDSPRRSLARQRQDQDLVLSQPLPIRHPGPVPAAAGLRLHRLALFSMMIAIMLMIIIVPQSLTFDDDINFIISVQATKSTAASACPFANDLRLATLESVENDDDSFLHLDTAQLPPLGHQIESSCQQQQQHLFHGPTFNNQKHVIDQDQDVDNVNVLHNHDIAKDNIMEANSNPDFIHQPSTKPLLDAVITDAYERHESQPVLIPVVPNANADPESDPAATCTEFPLQASHNSNSNSHHDGCARRRRGVTCRGVTCRELTTLPVLQSCGGCEEHIANWTNYAFVAHARAFGAKTTCAQIVMHTIKDVRTDWKPSLAGTQSLLAAENLIWNGVRHKTWVRQERTLHGNGVGAHATLKLQTSHPLLNDSDGFFRSDNVRKSKVDVQLRFSSADPGTRINRGSVLHAPSVAIKIKTISESNATKTWDIVLKTWSAFNDIPGLAVIGPFASVGDKTGLHARRVFRTRLSNFVGYTRTARTQIGSYLQQTYHGFTVRRFTNTTGAEQMMRIRLIPTDPKTDATSESESDGSGPGIMCRCPSGMLTKEDQFGLLLAKTHGRPWSMLSPGDVEKDLLELRHRLRELTQAHNDKGKRSDDDNDHDGDNNGFDFDGNEPHFLLQVQLRTFVAGETSWRAFNPIEPWPTNSKWPWQTLGSITLNGALDAETTSNLAFSPARAPSSIGIWQPTDAQDYRVLEWLRTRIYGRAQAIRNASVPANKKERPMIANAVTSVTGTDAHSHGTPCSHSRRRLPTITGECHYDAFDVTASHLQTGGIMQRQATQHNVAATPNAYDVARAFFDRQKRDMEQDYEEDQPGFTFQNILVAGFGQFAVHDMVMLTTNDSDLISSTDPISGDTLTLKRTSYRGVRSDGQRQYVNRATGFLDLSPVYGSTEKTLNSLRQFQGGRMRISTGNMPPVRTTPAELADALTQPFGNYSKYMTGDLRATQSPHLFAMHVMLLRAHNLLADEFAKRHPDWSDDRVFEFARLINIASFSFIATEYAQSYRDTRVSIAHYLELHGSVDVPEPWLPLELMHVYRWHSILPDSFLTQNHACSPPIRHSFLDSMWNDEFFLNDSSSGGIDGIVLGASLTPLRDFGSGVPQDLRHTQRDTASDSDHSAAPRNSMASCPHGFGESVTSKSKFDLAVVDILRARDRGIATFNEVREAYGLSRIDSFEQLTTDPQTLLDLKKLYPTIDDVELIVGLQVEQARLPNSHVSLTAVSVTLHTVTSLIAHSRFGFVKLLQSHQDTILDDLDAEEANEWLSYVTNSSMANLIAATTGGPGAADCLPIVRAGFRLPHTGACHCSSLADFDSLQPFPFALLAVLAGYACALWLAVTLLRRNTFLCQTLGADRVRKSATYAIEVVYQCVCLHLHVRYLLPILWYSNIANAEEAFEAGCTVAAVIIVTYVMEIVLLNVEMRISILFHHFVSIFLMLSSWLLLSQAPSISAFQLTCACILFPITEQNIFAALLNRNLFPLGSKWRVSATTLRLSAIWFGVTRVAVISLNAVAFWTWIHDRVYTQLTTDGIMSMLDENSTMIELLYIPIYLGSVSMLISVNVLSVVQQWSLARRDQRALRDCIAKQSKN
jgi:Animal haem peroxidase